MARSLTLGDRDPLPLWARYAVVFCHSHGLPDHDTIQVFASRDACERFAYAASHAFPARTGDALTMWALVYALPAMRAERGYWAVRRGQCYLSIDPGGVTLKRHEIGRFYGHPGHTEHARKCACCPERGWL